MNDAASDRIALIETSLRGFVCGIIGMLPFVGCIAGIYALFCWNKLSHRMNSEWNPASHYVTAGAIFSVLGLISTLLITAAIIVPWVNNV